MNIGLIIYSQTGNTKNVAGKLQEKLIAAGHLAVIEEIKITGKVPAQPGKFTLDHIPAVDSFDAVIFGAPVQAFSLNPVMKTYMKQLPSLSGKKVAIFVTKQIPLLWLGGTGAIAKMRKECMSRGAAIIGSEIIVWAEKKRSESINRGINNLSKLF